MGWLSEDLERYEIPRTGIVRAIVQSDIELCEISWSERSTREQWFSSASSASSAGEITRSRLYRCEIACNSEVATDDRVYTSSRFDREEWPIGWPET